MPGRAHLLATAVLLAGLSAGVASAASPSPGKRFSGTGGDYMNNARQWRNEARGRFHFTTSASGGRILHFYGTYSYYCGAGTSYLKAGYVTVTPRGTFNYEFHFKVRNGSIYGRIWGAFTGHGTTASVNYLANFIASGQRARDPWDVSRPRSLGCASWVRGVARAR